MLRSLTVQALRHRRGQAVVLTLLSALITGAAVVGPLYERAVDQVVLRSTLENAPVSATGLSLHRLTDVTRGSPASVLPAAVRPLFGPAIAGGDALVGLVTDTGTTDVRVASRNDLCAHLTFVAGGCPSAVTAVAVSAATARTLHLRVGSRIHVSITVEAVGAHAAVPLRVAGIYARFDPHAAYWFDHPYVGDGRSAAAPDALFAGDGMLPGVLAPIANANQEDVPIDPFYDIPLRTDAVQVRRAPVLESAINGLVTHFSDQEARADTQLDALLAGVAADRHQVHQVVPLFAGELILLALALLLFVVVAAAAGRRPEVALGRLRGQTRLTATGPMIAELGLPVLVGVPLGLVLATAGMALAGDTWLPSRVGVALPLPSLVAVAIALAAQLLVIVAVAQRLAREPVVTLLRRVPVRRSAVRLGQAEVGVAVLALAAVLTVVSSGLSGPVALLAPGLLALSIGLLLGAVGPVLAERIGRRALGAGRVRTGLAAVQLARRPGARGVLVVLVAAAAVLVAAADTAEVSAANRSARAQLEVGAPAVLDTGALSATALMAATAAIDPAGREVVPVVVVAPRNLGVVLLATHPAQAAALARWGWPHDEPSRTALARLDPPLPAPITLRGGSVDVDLGTVRLHGGSASDLFLDVVGEDGSPASYVLGTLPTRTSSAHFRISLPCQKGCRWQGFTVVRALTDTAGQYGQIDVDRLTTHPVSPTPGDSPIGTTVDIGAAGDWHGSTPTATTSQLKELVTGLTAPVTTDPSSLPPPTVLSVQPRTAPGFTLRFFDTGAKVSALHGDVPAAIPALTTRPTRTSTPSVTFDAGRLDGKAQLFLRTGTVAVMPGVPGNAALADIDIVARLADQPVSSTTYQVWLADGSARNVAHASAALAQHGVPVYDVRTIAARRSALAATGAALSLQVGLIAGALGLLIALGVVLITTITTLRGRRYDVAALRLSGVGRRVVRAALVGEGLSTALAGTVVGGVCGVAGGRLLLRAAPFLTGGSAFPAQRTYTAWWLVVAVVVGTLIVLAAVSGVLAAAIAGGATATTIREDS